MTHSFRILIGVIKAYLIKRKSPYETMDCGEK